MPVLVLENISINTTKLLSDVVSGLQYTVMNIIIFAFLLTIITIIILRIVKYVLAKLAASRVIPETLVEQIYKPLSSLAYIILAFIILYMAFKLPEIIYLIIVFVAVMLLASLYTLMDIISYYVILWENKLRPGDTIELPSLGARGVVEALTFTSVIIRRRDGTRIHIPNRILLSSPLRILTPIENRVLLEIEVSLPKGAKPARERLEDIEAKLRELLVEERLASRPQNVVIQLREMEPTRAVLLLEAPLPGMEPRSRQLNLLFERIAEELEVYSPRITLLTK